MYYYILCLVVWPISLVLELLLKIKRLFWPDNSVHILNYHSITSNIRGKRRRHVSVFPEVFAAQMKFLADNNFNIVDLDDLLKWREANQQIPPKTVILTFDDGYEDNYTTAFPILSKYKFKAILSVITSYIDRDVPFPWISQSLSEKGGGSPAGLPLSRWQLKAMSDYGITIASHTRHHIPLSRLDEREVFGEISESKRELEKMLSKKIRYFSYPYGSWMDFGDKDKKLVQSAGYNAALSTKVGCNTLKSDFYKLCRIPVYNIDGVSNFKRKVMGAYDFTALFQFLGSRMKRLIKRII